MIQYLQKECEARRKSLNYYRFILRQFWKQNKSDMKLLLITFMRRIGLEIEEQNKG